MQDQNPGPAVKSSANAAMTVTMGSSKTGAPVDAHMSAGNDS